MNTQNYFYPKYYHRLTEIWKKLRHKTTTLSINFEICIRQAE